jgi:hypothetical protein
MGLDGRADRRQSHPVVCRPSPRENAQRLRQVATRDRDLIDAKSRISLVPGERIELPTNGLQNRCSTAELTRRTNRHFKGLGLYAACAETPLATILLPTGLLPMK